MTRGTTEADHRLPRRGLILANLGLRRIPIQVHLEEGGHLVGVAEGPSGFEAA
jgi:hypothetical protein